VLGGDEARIDDERAGRDLVVVKAAAILDATQLDDAETPPAESEPAKDDSKQA